MQLTLRDNTSEYLAVLESTLEYPAVFDQCTGSTMTLLLVSRDVLAKVDMDCSTTV